MEGNYKLVIKSGIKTYIYIYIISPAGCALKYIYIYFQARPAGDISFYNLITYFIINYSSFI